jgi:hypothetical protein
MGRPLLEMNGIQPNKASERLSRAVFGRLQLGSFFRLPAVQPAQLGSFFRFRSALLSASRRPLFDAGLQ